MGKFGAAIGDLGMQTAQGVIGTGLGLLLEGHEDKRQLRQQEKLQALEMQGSKEMSKYNSDLQKKMQLEMWNETSYPAQMAKMKEAGINPALMYGMGGGGGVSTGGSLPQGNVKGGEAPKGTGTSTMMGLEMAQMGLLRAQKDNIEADTKNKLAEVPVKGATAEGIALDNLFKDTTMQRRIEQVGINVRTQIEQLHIAEADNYIKQDTILDEIETIANNALKSGFESTGADIMNESMRLEQNKITEQIKQITQAITESKASIKQKWAGLSIQEKERQLRVWEAGIKASFPGAGQVIGKVFNDVIEGFKNLMGGKKESNRRTYDTPKKLD